MLTSKAESRVWMVTGTSQGVGQALVQALLRRGEAVVATSRSPQAVAAHFAGVPDLFTVGLDLSDDASIAAAVAAAVERFGRIDVLVNNAGFGLLGAVEEASDSEIAAVFEVNVFGLLRVTRAVLPLMRAARRGHIVNLSSIAGLTSAPGWGIYSATKFAVEGLSEALALEVAPLGIGVTLVEPGPFRTDFLGGSLASAARVLDDYDGTAGRTRAWTGEHDGRQPGDPARAAEAIIQAVVDPEPPLRLLLGAIALERTAGKLERLARDIDRWRDVTLAADYPVGA